MRTLEESKLGTGFDGLNQALNFNINDSKGGQMIGGLYCEGIRIPGRPFQGTREQSTTKNYYFGTRRIMDDGRVFKYAYIGSTICYASAGVKSYDAQFCGWTAVATSQVAGDKQIQVASQTAAANVLEGGYIMLADSGDTRRQNRKITGNTYASSSTITVYLDEALDYALTADSSVCEIMYSPYRNCYYENNTTTSVIGVPAMNSASGYYIWLQTWGILTLSPGSATPDPGADAEERAVQFDAAGNLICYANGSSKDRQEAGFLVTNDAGGAGCPFIMLQISP